MSNTFIDKSEIGMQSESKNSLLSQKHHLTDCNRLFYRKYTNTNVLFFSSVDNDRCSLKDKDKLCALCTYKEGNGFFD